jgi:hypothetical protein
MTDLITVLKQMNEDMARMREAEKKQTAELIEILADMRDSLQDQTALLRFLRGVIVERPSLVKAK